MDAQYAEISNPELPQNLNGLRVWGSILNSTVQAGSFRQLKDAGIKIAFVRCPEFVEDGFRVFGDFAVSSSLFETASVLFMATVFS